MDNILKEISIFMREGNESQNSEWDKAKEKMKVFLEPKYFCLVLEQEDNFWDEGIVDIVRIEKGEVVDENIEHCVEKNDKTRIYIKNKICLGLHGNFGCEGEKVDYWIWQVNGYLGEDHIGYILLPMIDGRYWKIGYSH